MENIREEAPVTVPYMVHRDVVVHDRWIIKRLTNVLIVLVIMLFASNLAWLLVWNSYDYTSEEITTTVDSKGDGIANYTGGDGGVNYGQSDSPQTQDNED